MRDGGRERGRGRKGGERGRRVDDQLDKPIDSYRYWKRRKIYVADKGNHRVQIFNADLTYKRTCSLPDRDKSTVICPEKIAINSAGKAYVTNSKNTCVYVFEESGQFLFSFGRKGNLRDRGSLDLSSPTAIAIDSEDYVYISESNVGVSIFDCNGCFVKALGVRGSSPGNVKAMHIDTRGNLYVCESRNNHVCVFLRD